MRDHQEIVGLYQSGLSLREIGELVGCSHETVRYQLRKARVKVRRQGLNLRYTSSRTPSPNDTKGKDDASS